MSRYTRRKRGEHCCPDGNSQNLVPKNQDLRSRLLRQGFRCKGLICEVEESQQGSVEMTCGREGGQLVHKLVITVGNGLFNPIPRGILGKMHRPGTSVLSPPRGKGSGVVIHQLPSVTGPGLPQEEFIPLTFGLPQRQAKHT